MDILWRIISLGAVAVLYGLLAAGMKKYHIKDTVKRLTKKEKLMLAAGVCFLCLGILMQTARVPLATGAGVVTGNVYWLADLLMAENVTAVSLAVTVAILVPAVLYQVLFLERLLVKCRFSYCSMGYFLLLYAFHAGMYRNLAVTPGELLLLLAASALLYYGLEVLGGTRGKKGILYLACYVIGIAALIVLEQPCHWQMYAISGITMAEGLLMAAFRGKAIILRKTLRRLGTLFLFLLLIAVNYYLW